MAKEKLRIGSALVGTAAVAAVGVSALLVQEITPNTQREKVYVEFATRAAYERKRDEILDQWAATGQLPSIVELELFFKLLKHEDAQRKGEVRHSGIPSRAEVVAKYKSRKDELGKVIIPE